MSEVVAGLEGHIIPSWSPSQLKHVTSTWIEASHMITEIKQDHECKIWGFHSGDYEESMVNTTSTWCNIPEDCFLQDHVLLQILHTPSEGHFYDTFMFNILTNYCILLHTFT
jgi:hypothetical protein